jgi:tRNA (guanine-N7-)-methyltransferase
MSMILEIGPGRGDFLFHLAQENPEKTVAAIEYKRKRFDKLVRRVEARRLANVRLYFGDARLVLPQEFADLSCEAIYILFSDPWPKRRHAKHRLFQPSLVRELSRILVPEGRIVIAHDNLSYVAQIRKVFQQFIRFFVLLEDELDFPTFYAEKWKKEGRSIYSFSYKKINCNVERDHLSLPCEFPTDETA